MKGKSSIILSLIVAAVGIKILVALAGSYENSEFSGMISGFTGLADLLFYGLVVIIILLIPYQLSRRKKNAVPDRTGPVGRE